MSLLEARELTSQVSTRPPPVGPSPREMTPATRFGEGCARNFSGRPGLARTSKAAGESIQAMIVTINGRPVDQNEPGTDLASAVAGKVPLGTHDIQLLLRRVDASSGWREVYDGPAPENFADRPGDPLPRILDFAAPNGAGWQSIGFLEQADGSFTAVWSPDAAEAFED